MSAPDNRLPRPKRPVRAEDLPDWLLANFPNIGAELNTELVLVDVFVGADRPGRSWDGWTAYAITLEEALALPVEGRA